MRRDYFVTRRFLHRAVIFTLYGLPLQAHSAENAAARPEAETIEVKASALHDKADFGGGGLMRPVYAAQATSIVSKPFIDAQAPIFSAYQLVNNLPGANVAASDPFGLSPYTNVTVRGLNSDALGFTLEGTPLNDIAYYGAYPAQFADAENYRTIAVTQGAAAISDPVLNAAGGLMALTYLQPAKTPGGTVNVSYGAYANSRQFLRLESGEIGQSGVRGFVSYSHTTAHNWRGPGEDRRQHVDLKFVKSIRKHSDISLIGSWNRAVSSYYPQVTLDAWHADGIGGSNNLKAWYDAGHVAQAQNYYRLWEAPEQTFYGGLPSHFALSNHLSLQVTPYAQAAYGSVASGATLPTSGIYNGVTPVNGHLRNLNGEGGDAVVRANGVQESYRTGFNAHLSLETGRNKLTFGYWYDYSDDREVQSFTPVAPDGRAPNLWARQKSGLVSLPDGQPLYGSAFHTIGQVNALYVSDRLSLFRDKMVLEAGFKDVIYAIRGTNNLPSPQYRTGGSYQVPLPRMSIKYHFRPEHQLFANVTTNFRAPSSTAFYDYYDVTSGAVVTDGAQKLNPEYSISEELGYRYFGKKLLGSVTFFNYNFTNRQITTEIFRFGAPVQTTVNAGGQTSRGVDVEISMRPYHHWSPYISAEYLHATIDNDIAVDRDLLPTRGKIAVRSPALQASIGLSYDNGHVFGMATAHYTGRQYASFMNDVAMPGYVTGNLALGYRFDDRLRLKAPNIRVNFTNIGNNHALSGVSSVTLVGRDTIGRRGTRIAASDPLFYIGSGFAVLFTAGAGF